MKVALVAHGYPPELVGGVELSVQALARELAARGIEVAVFAGTMQPSTRSGEIELRDTRDGAVAVRRAARDDLHFDHWHKSLSPGVTRAFREWLREVRADVVHVHHWLRLSRDLVAAAAREGVPAVVTLHDAWASCPIAFRVRSDTRESCDAPTAAHPCLACAGRVPPRTPWVTVEQGFMLLAERQRDLKRELELARARIVPTRTHGDSLARWLELGERSAFDVVAPARTPLNVEQRARLAFDGSVLRLGAWGHIAPHKGQDVLLDAIARLREPRRVQLEIAGGSDPAFVATLRGRAADLDLKFHGAYRLEELARHPVTDVHAMVSGSRASESYGIVLDEARELGLPALVPSTEAFVERFGDDPRGRALYASGSSTDLARVLERWLAEPSELQALSTDAWSARFDRPTAAEIAERHVEIYREVVTLGAPRVAAAEWFEERMQREALQQWDRSLVEQAANPSRSSHTT